MHGQSEMEELPSIDVLMRLVPERMVQPTGHELIVTKIIADKLGMDLSDADRGKRRAALVKAIRSLDQGKAEALRLTLPEVPEDVHLVGRKGGLLLHLGGCDEICTALKAAGRGFEDGKSYLDFGCSSGRTVRTMAAAFPESSWFGADPVESTIDWARGASGYVDFVVSPQKPPIQVAANKFDGVYAVSVWSHFQEQAAKDWFGEMHRIIKPGGFLYFTTPSYRKFFNLYNEGRRHPGFAAKLAELMRNGFAFRGGKERRGLDTSIWGEAHMSVAWVCLELLSDWKLVNFVPAGHQAQQDIFVIEKR